MTTDNREMNQEIDQFDDYEAFENALNEGEETKEEENQYLDYKDPKKHTKKGEGKFLSYTCTEDSTVLEFMFASINDKSKTTVRSYLKNRQVTVNGMRTTQFDARIKAGDMLDVNLGVARTQFNHTMLDIVYEDDHILIVNKKNGILTMATDRERKRTAYFVLSEYLKSQDSQNRIFIVHRLDRETSGLLMFAKSMEIQHRLQKNWAEMVLERKYVAVVGGCPELEEGTVKSYLKENKAHIMYSTYDEDGDYAATKYKVLKYSRTKSLVELELLTGRKNQIRVHMKDLGCPIIGDKKYGGEPSDMRRVALHAYRIRFIHPVTEKEMLFDTGIPSRFQKFFFFN